MKVSKFLHLFKSHMVEMLEELEKEKNQCNLLDGTKLH